MKEGAFAFNGVVEGSLDMGEERIDETGKAVAWNETRWVDEEFMQLLRQAERTLNVPKRKAIMCQLQTIMTTRGPVGIAFWKKVWNITRSEFKNMVAHPTSYDLFTEVWKDA